MITSTITSMIDHIDILEYSPGQKDSPNAQDTTTVVPADRKASPLNSGHSTKNGVMWTLKHDISSSKFYELLIKTELKVNTALYVKNF